MRDSESFKQVHSELLKYLYQDPFLLVHGLLVSPEESPFRILLEAHEDVLLLLGKESRQSRIIKVFWGRTVVVVGLSAVNEGMGSHGEGTRHNEGIVVDISVFRFLILVNLNCFVILCRWDGVHCCDLTI